MKLPPSTEEKEERLYLTPKTVLIMYNRQNIMVYLE